MKYLREQARSRETKLRDKLSHNQDTQNMKEGIMSKRRRKRSQQEEVVEEEEIETTTTEEEIEEEEDFDDEEEEVEDEGEETEDFDDEDVEEEEKPKKKGKGKTPVRKKREKRLKFHDSAPAFIMHIRDVDTALSELNSRKTAIGKNQFEIGHLLLHIKSNKLFAPRYKSFAQFCQSQEVGYSVAQAANLVNVVKAFEKDSIEAHGMTKLLPVTRLKDQKEAESVLSMIDSGELTDVKSVEKAVKEQKSYPHTPSKVTGAAKEKMAIKEKKGVKGLLNKTLKLYMLDDDDKELKTAKALQNAKDASLYIPITEGVSVRLKTTDGVLWVAKFVADE
jgi:hypothetical protein